MGCGKPVIYSYNRAFMFFPRATSEGFSLCELTAGAEMSAAPADDHAGFSIGFCFFLLFFANGLLVASRFSIRILQFRRSKKKTGTIPNERRNRIVLVSIVFL